MWLATGAWLAAHGGMFVDPTCADTLRAWNGLPPENPSPLAPAGARDPSDLPAPRLGSVHIAGTRLVGGGGLLDDLAKKEIAVVSADPVRLSARLSLDEHQIRHIWGDDARAWAILAAPLSERLHAPTRVVQVGIGDGEAAPTVLREVHMDGQVLHAWSPEGRGLMVALRVEARPSGPLAVIRQGDDPVPVACDTILYGLDRDDEGLVVFAWLPPDDGPIVTSAVVGRGAIDPWGPVVVMTTPGRLHRLNVREGRVEWVATARLGAGDPDCDSCITGSVVSVTPNAVIRIGAPSLRHDGTGGMTEVPGLDRASGWSTSRHVVLRHPGEGVTLDVRVIGPPLRSLGIPIVTAWAMDADRFVVQGTDAALYRLELDQPEPVLSPWMPPTPRARIAATGPDDLVLVGGHFDGLPDGGRITPRGAVLAHLTEGIRCGADSTYGPWGAVFLEDGRFWMPTSHAAIGLFDTSCALLGTLDASSRTPPRPPRPPPAPDPFAARYRFWMSVDRPDPGWLTALVLLLVPLLGAWVARDANPPKAAPPTPAPARTLFLNDGWIRFSVAPMRIRSFARELLTWGTFWLVMVGNVVRGGAGLLLMATALLALLPWARARYRHAPGPARGALLALPVAHVMAGLVAGGPALAFNALLGPLSWLWNAIGVRAFLWLPWVAVRVVIDVDEGGVHWWPQVGWVRLGAPRPVEGPITCEAVGDRTRLRVGELELMVEHPAPEQVAWLAREAEQRNPTSQVTPGATHAPFWLHPWRWEPLFLVPGLAFGVYVFAMDDPTVRGLVAVAAPMWIWALVVSAWARRSVSGVSRR